MKKILSLILITILSFSLVACGQEKKETTLKDVVNSKDSKEANEKLNDIKEEQKKNVCSIVLADTKNVKIICKGKGKSALGGIYITLYIENKTKKDILVGVDKCSNNGSMVDALFGETISAGMKSENDLSVMKKEITEVKDFKGTFNIMDNSKGEIIENIDFNIK
ncbi:hypothetical protein ACER0A_002230 [Haloimpatiens sp. FM7315]|uniref:hypothetical protein n=1 Tax=Haloimpatiens sp. FM7315 TaxID=3298609 RepID=UPI00370AFFB9